MITWLSMAALVVIGLLGWNLYRRLGADRIAQLNERRRPTSRLVSRGEFVDGPRNLPVALALTRSTFFYENSDLQGTLDLKWVREIEYDNELATGAPVKSGRVLRLRAYSQMFEFVIPQDVVQQWHMMLPPRRLASRADTSTAVEVAV